jgi:hypothetical protein
VSGHTLAELGHGFLDRRPPALAGLLSLLMLVVSIIGSRIVQ